MRGTRVIVAGLDMDFSGKPFGPIPGLLAIADYITKLHAICVVCGNIANYSYRKSSSTGQIMLGEKELYEPRCRICAQTNKTTWKQFPIYGPYLKKIGCLKCANNTVYMVFYCM